jgi:hypothetical protein
MINRRKLVSGIGCALLVTLTSCDNVEWGGVQVSVREPEYESPASLEADSDTLAEVSPLEMPTGPLLFHVLRTDDAGSATIEAVAELVVGELKVVGPQSADRSADYASEFVGRYFEPDQPYVLYRDGLRVGTFYVVADAVSGSGLCLDLAATGRIELRPGADTLSEFTAWPAGAWAGEGELAAPETRGDMRSLAQILARRGLEESGVGGAIRIRNPADLRALDVGAGRYGFAATFVTGDTLGTGSPFDSAGSVFLVADYNAASGFFPLFFDAAWYGAGEKRVLRWLDAADLIGDGEAEWLLRAYGDTNDWYEVMAGADTSRSVIWTSRRPECDAR